MHTKELQDKKSRVMTQLHYFFARSNRKTAIQMKIKFLWKEKIARN